MDNDGLSARMVSSDGLRQDIAGLRLAVDQIEKTLQQGNVKAAKEYRALFNKIFRNACVEVERSYNQR